MFIIKNLRKNILQRYFVSILSIVSISASASAMNFQDVKLNLNIGVNYASINTSSKFEVLNVQQRNLSAAENVMRQRIFYYDPFHGMEFTMGGSIDYKNKYGIKLGYLQGGPPIVDDPEYQIESSSLSYYYYPYSETSDTINMALTKYDLSYALSRAIIYFHSNVMTFNVGFEKGYRDIYNIGDNSIPYVGYLINEGNRFDYTALLLGVDLNRALLLSKLQLDMSYYFSPKLNSVKYPMKYGTELNDDAMIYHNFRCAISYKVISRVSIELFTGVQLIDSKYIHMDAVSSGISMSYSY